MRRPENSTHEWIADNICQDFTFWLVTSGCLVFGFLLGVVVMGLICRRKYHLLLRSSSNGKESSKGTYYFEERHNLSRRPQGYSATSNFYTNDITDRPASSTNFYENQRHEKSVDQEVDESDDEQVDDYIKMNKPTKDVPRSNSRKQRIQKIDQTAMYISMS